MPKEAPNYEMDPSFWQIPSEPLPPYEDDEEPLAIKEPLAIEGRPEGPEEPEGEDTSYLQLPEEED